LSQKINHIESATQQPWYRQFWPWFLIALPAAAVIAGFFTLYLAITHPDPLIIDAAQYRNLDHSLKAQKPIQTGTQTSTQTSISSDQATHSQ